MNRLLMLSAALLLSSAAHSQELVIENVTVIDGSGGPSMAGMTVEISNGRFIRLHPSSGAPVSSRRKIDGTGKFLMPGIIDVHVHLLEVGEERARRESKAIAGLASFLLAGVTTLYDAGNDPDVMVRMRAKEREGWLASPRIFTTGSHVTLPGGQGSDETGAVLVGTGTRGTDDFRRYLSREKPDMAKIIVEDGGWGPVPRVPTFKPEALERIIRAANQEGIRTTVHVSSERWAEDAIFAGADTLAHPPIIQPISDGFAKMVAAKRIPIATTMAVGDFRARVVADSRFLDTPLYAASVSASDLAAWRGKGEGSWQKSQWTDWRLKTVRLIQANLAKMHSAGAILALGSDLGLGAFAHREMELLQDAGIAAKDIVTIATLNGARFLGKERELGSIAPGKLADALLLAADPTANILNAQSIELVIKSGKVVDAASLPLAGDKARVRRP